MTKVRILGHRSALDQALARLYRLGLVQLVDVVETEPELALPPLGLDAARLRELERLRLLRARIEGLLDLLPPGRDEPRTATPEPAEIDFAAVATEVEALGPRVEELVGRLDALAAEAESLPRHVAALRRLVPLAEELPDLRGSEVAALLVERRQVRVLPALRRELEAEVGRAVEIVSAPLDADTVGALVVFPRAEAARVQSLLGREQVSRVRLPERFEGMPFQRAIAAMERRQQEIPVAQASARDALDDLLRPRRRWVGLHAAASARIAQLEAMRGLVATPSSFVAVGWVPTDRWDVLRQAVADAPVEVERCPPTPGEDVPVALRNPPLARPFERFVDLLSLPRYGSLDPSIPMALFMPLFFGMMLGDIAYGVLLLSISLWLSWRWGRRSALVADVARILRPCALWTIGWGFVYGELLGDLGHRMHWLEPIWINREEALAPLLAFAVGVGAFHIVLSLVLGLASTARQRRWRAFGQRAATLLALVGAGGLLVAAAGRLPAGLGTAAGVAVVAGLVILAILEGALGVLLGPLELLGTVGHVLSYLRIAAIGLASVYLARVANELGTAGPLWVGLPVAALLHGLNLILGVFSPTIQALRLHYVEFFRGFYEDGGLPFRPFGADRPTDPDRPSASAGFPARTSERIDEPWTPPPPEEHAESSGPERGRVPAWASRWPVPACCWSPAPATAGRAPRPKTRPPGTSRPPPWRAPGRTDPTRASPRRRSSPPRRSCSCAATPARGPSALGSGSATASASTTSAKSPAAGTTPPARRVTRAGSTARVRIRTGPGEPDPAPGIVGGPWPFPSTPTRTAIATGS